MNRKIFLAANVSIFLRH